MEESYGVAPRAPTAQPTAAQDEEREGTVTVRAERLREARAGRVMKRSSPGGCQGCKVNDPKGI